MEVVSHDVFHPMNMFGTEEMPQMNMFGTEEMPTELKVEAFSSQGLPSPRCCIPSALEQEFPMNMAQTYPIELATPVEQDYTYGATDTFSFSNDDLRSIYANYFQSEFEAYLGNLALGTLYQQIEMLTAHRIPLTDVIEDCALTQCMSLFDLTWSSEIIGSVSEQEYLFAPMDLNDITPLDKTTVIEDPHVVLTATRDGVVMPLPTSVMLVKLIQGKATSRMLRVLFDTGSTNSHAHISLLPPGTALTPLEEKKLVNTLAGLLAPKGAMTLEGLRLPEFDRAISVDRHEFQVFTSPCKYDLIVGMDLMTRLGITINLRDLTVTCFGQTLPMNSSNFTKERLSAFVDHCLLEDELDFMGEDLDELYAVEIAESKYEKTDLLKFVEEHCSHLDTTQRQQLLVLLRRHEKLFDGSLGCFEDMELDIKLKPGAQPVWRCPYPIPHDHLELFRKELMRLVELGVLAPVVEPTSWGLPTFITPKKPEPDGTRRVRWVSDLRELNKVIVPYNYTLPIITDVLREHRACVARCRGG